MNGKFVCSVCRTLLSKPKSTIRQLAIGRFLHDSPSDESGCTSFTSRSHTCGELTRSDCGKQVTICGWLQYHRLNQFIILRDWHGLTQIVIPEEKRKDFEDFPLESVVKVTGVVQQRPHGQENKTMSTGEVEVILDNCEILNSCKTNLPFNIQDFHKVKESLRMEYRYLDLRNKELQHNLRLRSDMVMKMREFLCNRHSFVEVETPTLFRRTPGGAKEFIVPSNFPGKFYSLPQSPQQFKQLLMVGGLDRYVQIARCYRDEGSKPERQPEFTQVDIEMSFVTQDNVLDLVEKMLVHCWPDSKGRLSTPFPRMTYQEAMTKYGTDKPDTRFDWQLCDVTDIFRDSGLQAFQSVLQQDFGSVQAVVIPQGTDHLSNKDVSNLQSLVKKEYSQTVSVIKVQKDGNIQSPLLKHLHADVVTKLRSALTPLSGDLILLSAGRQFEPVRLMVIEGYSGRHGRTRVKYTVHMKSSFPKCYTDVEVRNPSRFLFMWIVDFPLFLQSEQGVLESCHHPFTAPHPDDAQLVYTKPEQVRSQHYDLVLNGSEIGGGSVRIHDASLQRYVIDTVLKEDSSELTHLLDALESGCPPHGGIALGLDRLMALVCGASSIRDVIAFPKSHDGKDPMSKAPAEVTQAELDAYHIKVKQV